MKPINEEIKTEILSAPHIAEEAAADLRDWAVDGSGKLVKRVRDEHPNLRAENERLRAENHKLRAENNRLTVSANEVAALQAELDRVRRVQRAEAQPVIAPRSGYRWGLLP